MKRIALAALAVALLAGCNEPAHPEPDLPQVHVFGPWACEDANFGGINRHLCHNANGYDAVFVTQPDGSIVQEERP